MKFCKDCEWIRYSSLRIGIDSKCASPAYDKDRDMVDGHYCMLNCFDLRNDKDKCGKDSRWFEEKKYS